MAITALTSAEAAALSVKTLRLDSESVALDSDEALTAALLRAASFMCPTSPNSLAAAVVDAVQPLVSVGDVSRERVADLLDLLVAAGDLLELRRDVDGRSVRLLYLGPPSFIERSPGTYLLLGVRPYGAPLLDEGLLDQVEHEGHVRAIHLGGTDGAETLRASGLQQIERRRWVASPRVESATDLLRRTAERLDVAGGGGDIEGLQIIDPATRVGYYRGRWRQPLPTDTGDFVGRRPQAYGADLWSAVRLENGAAIRIFQFPVDDPTVPARDEAWRAQMAIDVHSGKPQRFETEPMPGGGSTVVKFFSPVPGFAERYLRIVGLPLAGTSGALFAFRVPDGAMPELVQLLTNSLWLEHRSREAT